MGSENLDNLNKLSQVTREVSFELGVESHLLLVGGIVRPEKQGKYHKDLDIVFYCPTLATEYYVGGSQEKFDKFSDFFRKVSEKLNWKIETENPWFYDFESAGDGKVILSSDKGVPIEVLPVREDRISGSFENFLKSENNPHEVLF